MHDRAIASYGHSSGKRPERPQSGAFHDVSEDRPYFVHDDREPGLRVRDQRAEVRGGSSTDAGAVGAGGSGHWAGEGADPGHPQAHATGRNLHSEHQARCETLHGSGRRPVHAEPRGLCQGLRRQELQRPQREERKGRQGVFQGLAGRHAGTEQGLGPGKVHLQSQRLHADDVSRSDRLRQESLRVQLRAPRVSGHGAHGGVRCAPQGEGHGPLLRPHLDRGPGRQRGPLQRHLHGAERRRLEQILFPLRLVAHERAAGRVAAGCGVRGRNDAHRGRENSRLKSPDALLGLQPEAAHARQ